MNALSIRRASLSLAASNPPVWVVAGALMAALVAYGRFAVELQG